MYSILFSELFATWALGIPLAYLTFVMAFSLLGWFPNTVRGSDGAPIMAFNLVSCAICAYIGGAGVIAWLGLCSHCDLEAMHIDKVYGRSDYFENHLAAPLICYQFWNFIISLSIPELRDPVMLIHHFAAFLCPLLSLYPFLQYYGMFFYGVPEVTSVPLTFVGLAKSFPYLKEKYPLLFMFSKLSFGIFFLLIRIVLWTEASYSFWLDMHRIVVEGEAHSILIVGYFCLANILLTSMQYFWGYKIIIQMVGGSKSKKEPKEKKLN